MDKIIKYIKKLPLQNVRVIITINNVKVVHDYDNKTYDLFTIEEFEKELECV